MLPDLLSLSPRQMQLWPRRLLAVWRAHVPVEHLVRHIIRVFLVGLSLQFRVSGFQAHGNVGFSILTLPGGLLDRWWRGKLWSVGYDFAHSVSSEIVCSWRHRA